MESSKTILLTGVTGQQGGAVLAALRSHPAYPSLSLRAIVRDPSSAAKKLPSDPSLSLHAANLTSVDSLIPALSDVHTAFLVTFPSPSPESEVTQGKAFIDAAVQAGVRYIVFSSVGAAERNTGVPHFESKREVERYLSQSGIPHAIIRPVAFMDNFPVEAGIQRFFTLGLFSSALAGKKIQLVAVKDIGRVVADALVNETGTWEGKEVELAGDEVDVPGILEAWRKVTGTTPWVAWLPWWLLSFGLPTDIYLMFKFFWDKGYKADIPALKKQFPDLQSFEDFLRDKQGKKEQ
ncbi:hypothetical protein ABW21_db0208650 [Orbilia brochopaga]|nr:hypothetical protein ABW21_db0208650 [Drechslerella brochopaga]